jgi:peroxiredoxin
MIRFGNNKKSYLTTVLLIIFLIAFSSVAFPSTLKKYFPAPTFSLKTIEGDYFNLEDQREKQKLLILYFYSQDNDDSLTGIKKLVEYFEDHIIQEKYEVFLINTQEKLQEKDLELMKGYLSDNKVSFPVILDNQKKVSGLYNIDTLPTAIFLDNNLVVKRVYPGLASNQQTLMFQYTSYLLASEKKRIPKKEKEEVVEEPDVCTCIKKPSF